MQNNDDLLDDEGDSGATDDLVTPAERIRIMLTAFRRAPTITRREAESLRARYRRWREERLAPFVSVLADMVLRSMGVES